MSSTIEESAGVPPVATNRPHKRLKFKGRGRLATVLFWFAVIWLIVVIGCALTAQWLPIPDPDIAVGAARMPPFTDWSQPLGTDGLGRSILSRSIYGAQASLAVGLFSVIVGMLVGGALGLIAGYFRGKLDAVIGTLADAMLAFPGLILILAIAAVLGPGTGTVVLGLGLISLPTFLRITRANTMRYEGREFVQAARLIGARSGRVIVKEVIPNILPPLVAYAVIVMATLITTEAALSFLGLGLRPPTPSWGSAIADGRFDLADAPFLVFIPAAILTLTVFSFNLVGDRIRSLLDSSQAKI